MSLVPLIERKRDGNELNSAEINRFISAVADGSAAVPQTASQIHSGPQ